MGDAEGFEASEILNILHRSLRFLGGNEFVFPFKSLDELNNSFNLTSLHGLLNTEAGQYYIGVFSSTFVMLALLLVWLILLFDACSLSKGRNIRPYVSNRCLASLLLASFLMSAIGWFYSISGYYTLHEGFEKSGDGLLLVEENTANAALVYLELQNLEPFLQSTYANIQNKCPFSNINKVARISRLSTGMFISVKHSGAQISIMNDVVVLVDDSLAAVTDVVGPIYFTFTVFLIVFLALFSALTAVKGACHVRLKRLTNTCGSIGVCVLYSAGLILVIITWIMASVLSPFGKMGADICIGDAAENLGDAFRALEETPTEDFCTLDFTPEEEATFDYVGVRGESAGGNLLCYYSECRGFNIYFKQLGVNVTNGVITSAITVDSLISLIESISIGGDENNCSGAKQFAIQSIEQVMLPRLKQIVDYLDCQVFTPVYDVTNENLCNGIFAGIAKIYVTWTIGSAGMMIGMYLYLVQDDDNAFGSAVWKAAESVYSRACCGPTQSKRIISIQASLSDGKNIIIPSVSGESNDTLTEVGDQIQKPGAGRDALFSPDAETLTPSL